VRREERGGGRRKREQGIGEREERGVEGRDLKTAPRLIMEANVERCTVVRPKSLAMGVRHGEVNPSAMPATRTHLFFSRTAPTPHDIQQAVGVHRQHQE